MSWVKGLRVLSYGVLQCVCYITIPPQDQVTCWIQTWRSIVKSMLCWFWKLYIGPSSLNPKKTCYWVEICNKKITEVQSYAPTFNPTPHSVWGPYFNWYMVFKTEPKVFWFLTKTFFNKYTFYQGIDFKNRFEISFQKYSNLEFS